MVGDRGIKLIKVRKKRLNVGVKVTSEGQAGFIQGSNFIIENIYKHGIGFGIHDPLNLRQENRAYKNVTKYFFYHHEKNFYYTCRDTQNKLMLHNYIL